MRGIEARVKLIGMGLMERYGVTLLLSPPRTPQYNGVCEASIGWMQKHTRKLTAIRCGHTEQWGSNAVLRITRVVDDATGVTLKVEGQITSDWISVLERECLTALRDKRELILDFSGVAFIDAEGTKMLDSLRSRALPPERLQIINSSPLIEDLLKRGLDAE